MFPSQRALFMSILLSIVTRFRAESRTIYTIRASRSLLPLQHCPNVTVLVFFLKKDVPLLHLALLHVP